MIITYFNKIVFWSFTLMCCLYMQDILGQNDTLYIGDNFKENNLQGLSKTYSTNESFAISKAFDSLYYKGIIHQKEFFFFDFNNQFNYISFTIKNRETSSKKLMLKFNNSQIDKIVIYQKENQEFKLINSTGIDYPFRTRGVEHRNFLFPIELKNTAPVTYIIKLEKNVGKPLVTGLKVFNDRVFKKKNVLQYTFIGFYLGLSLLSILFSLFAFYYLRNYAYLIYAFYVIFLALFISSYLGIFAQFLLDDGTIFKKYNNYVLFSETSLLLFVIFAQRVLKAKENAPTIKKIVDIFVVVLISVRFSLHFIIPGLFEKFTSFFMLIWYGVFLAGIVAVFIEIIMFYKKNRTQASLFVFAYVFMLIGALFSILYHSLGFTNIFTFGLPIVFYTSTLEILFLTFTIIFMVKEIYDERNVLSTQLAHQQQKFLTAFIDGQERERERIGKELHDNVGSRLGNFKRLFLKKYSNKKMSDDIDQICNDVRELSHQITPSEMKLVGLPGAISDLITKYSDDGLTIEFNCYEYPDKLNETIKTNLYRVVQESLNNIIKHAEANSVDVQLIGHKDYLTLSIEDDGKGFNSSNLLSGIGLRNMKARIEKLKGNFLIDTSLNSGTSILITVPIQIK